MWSLAVDNGSSGVIRMKAGDTKVAVAFGKFLMQCVGDAVIADFR